MSQQMSFDGLDAQPTDRLFFAVFPDPETASRIAECAQDLRDRHGMQGKLVRKDRLHITLHHLGDYAGLPQDIVTKANKAAESVSAAQFDVTFDRAASFAGRPGNLPIILLGSDGVVSLVKFQQQLGEAMMKTGLAKRAEKNFTPHVTLLYDKVRIDEHAIEPISWTTSEFVLVHSRLGATQHIQLGRFPLGR